jgi:hypothetical protein
MLGRLQMSVTDAITDYGKLVEKVFSDTRLIREDEFRASKLEEVFKGIVKEKTGKPDELMMDGRPEGSVCKTCAVSDCFSCRKVD